MASTVTIDLRHVARGLDIPLPQVQATVELLDEGNTVPFITRYRKDQTGGLDEEQVRDIQARLGKVRLLADRKQTILRSIEAQGKLTEKLTKQILSASTTKRLEDLYLPFKPKKQTLATLARSRGLEELAHEILEANPTCNDLDARAADFANSDRQVPTAADALLGAGHILAEQFSEQAELRQRLREILQRTGVFVSNRVVSETKPAADHAAPAEPAAPVAAAPETDGQARETLPEAVTDTVVAALLEDQAVNASAKPTDAEPAATEQESVASEAESAVAPADEQPSAPKTDAIASESEQTAATETAATETETTPETASASAQAAEAVVDDAAAESPAAPAPEAASVSAAPVSAAPGETPPSPATSPAPAPLSGAAQRKLARAAAKQAQQKKRELKKKKLEEMRIKAFRDYFDYREELKKIPPHRILAINRGERARVLRVKVECDLQAMMNAVDEALVPPGHPHADYLRGCARDALTRLILPSLEREARRELTDRAEAHAVGVFAKNLRNLLLQPPIHNHRVLAVDPGFKSGCKLAALDQFGNLLEHAVVFLVGKPERRQEAKQKVLDLIERFQLTVIVVGNGTACRETEDFCAELIEGELKERGVAYVIVNEAGASVYSTSRIGREELPDCDATLRGAISIGRRLQDPLSELVKIDPASIGVGLYQHDVKAKHLRTSLDEVVESCVNYVGVDVNMASPALLGYISGLNQLTARRLYEYRREHGPFRTREELREVPGLGDATFIQSAGFLKIAKGDNPLDATWIHPESYPVAMRVLERLHGGPADLREKDTAAQLAEHVAQVDQEALARELEVGLLTLKDILAQLVRPGRDPRDDLPAPVFKRGVLKLEDLSPGMELTGAVLNVVDFGCFVDIGMHDSGLVHVSRLADKFIRDPHEVVAVGDIVKVWVVDIDKERRRVSLTMVRPGSERPKPVRPSDAAGGEQGARSGRRQHGRPQRGSRPGAEQRSGEQGRAQDGRGARPPRSEGGERRTSYSSRPQRGGRPPQHAPHRPKPRPKPVVPITDAMKTGKEPMRTFGDLLQFYQQKPNEPDAPTEPTAASRPAVPAEPVEKSAAEAVPAAPDAKPAPEAPPAAESAAESPDHAKDTPAAEE